MNYQRNRYFFSGIGGSGMSAIACFLADRGCKITGSDRSFDQNPAHPLSAVLKSKGITIVPQDGSAIDNSFDCAIFSTAVELGQPEMVKAKALGILTLSRPDFLAELTEGFMTIAVAGTSGKSTTAGMLSFIMQGLGMEPNFIGGGKVRQFSSPAHPGNSLTGTSDFLIVEACESDGTIVNYKPLHTIILNLDLDHHPVEETSRMFRALTEHTSGITAVNADDKYLSPLRSKSSISYSLVTPSDYQATGITFHPLSTDFMVQKISFSIALPGRHNVYNALACIAILNKLGVNLEDIAPVLARFRGIERRFDLHFDNSKQIVIDDYAHNPHKIGALMETVKRIRQRVCYVFQPHGFGPTRMMKDEYIRVFKEHLRDSDHLILLPIFYAGGTASKDISSRDLVLGVRAGGKSAEAAENREDILRRLKEWDAVVVLGARDDTLSEFARRIAGCLQQKYSTGVS